MKKLKVVFWVVIIGLLVIIFFQNQEFFLTQYSFQINLLFLKYQSPKVPSAVLFLAFFLVGLLIAYVFSLAERFRLKKTIKNLNATLDSQTKTLPLAEQETGQSQSKEGALDREQNAINRSAQN